MLLITMKGIYLYIYIYIIYKAKRDWCQFFIHTTLAAVIVKTQYSIFHIFKHLTFFCKNTEGIDFVIRFLYIDMLSAAVHRSQKWILF